ncbi:MULTISPECIES: helix-turn-helix domain-containing protein [Streptomyces]|uniref:Helix-turn-helix domain-containing protein n=1 Tax=Streptomyces koelreuteriae TaxID=2838015 RepID=A0ABX8G2M2_9ACTN|nr:MULTISPECIES: helix-turn-helix domain-containing protein [Streptomyces]QWB27763.1 helix-turn-helix domain-containing protein [Streptomyces koelreuteriae]UUA10865.1 helix-turn-helix domain-containing protein [Streptomyces koelreuteriae]UUA18471.1 helix-turn-helix domain-containing protein [Streptomyces sp. CRCS-T-1]
MLVLDTDGLPAADRYEALRTVVAREGGVDVVEEDEPAPTMWKRLEVWHIGPLTLFDTRGTGARFVRSYRKTRRELVDTVSIMTQAEGFGTGAYGCDGYQRRLGPDGVGLSPHMVASHEYGWSGTGRSVAFSLDIAHLALPVDTVRAAVPLLHHSPVEPLLVQHIRGLRRHADRFSGGPEAEALAAATVHLTRALIVSAAGDDPTRREVARETLFTRVLAYLRAHLTEPDLTPQRVARAHGISVRTLYRLCEEGGLSLEKWVIRRRLEGAREDLAAAEQAHRTVEAIARSWGFAHPAHFSRRFRETYGTSPSEWRRHSRDDLSRRAAPPP